MSWPIAVGDRVKFAEERMRYTVRAISPDGRYAICTRPFNRFGKGATVMYCILDFVEQWRAPDDRVFSGSYETVADIGERMRELVDGEIGLSRRHGITLRFADAAEPRP